MQARLRGRGQRGALDEIAAAVGHAQRLVNRKIVNLPRLRVAMRIGGEIAGTSLMSSHASARTAVASSTAVRSDPPRPSDVIVPPALTPRKPGTITMRDAPAPRAGAAGARSCR